MNHLKQLAGVMSECGIRHGFGVASDGVGAQMAEILAGNGMSFHNVTHDAAAAYMAGACCRLGDTNALSITTKGPAFAAAFAGVVTNYLENRPAALLSEYYPDHQPRYHKFQRISHDAVGRGIFKADGTCDPGAEEVRGLMATARAETPGPVLLQIAEDPDDSVVCVMPPEHFSVGELGPLLDQVRKAQSPVLVLGGPVPRRIPPDLFHDVKVPVLTTVAAKGSIADTHPFAAGLLGDPNDPVPANVILEQADLIVGLGLRNTEIVEVKPFPKPLVVIDLIDGTLRGTYRGGLNPLQEVIRPRLKDTVASILKALGRKSWGEELIAQRKQAQRQHFAPTQAGKVFEALRGLPDTTLVVDGSDFRICAETLWEVQHPQHFMGAANTHAQGTALPCGIGETFARPFPVICAVDASGIWQHLNELQLAVAQRLPLWVIVLGAVPGICGAATALGMKTTNARNPADLRKQAEHINEPILTTLNF